MTQQFTNEEFQAVLQACRRLPSPQGNYHEHDYVLTLMNTVLDYQMTRPILANATAYFQDHHAEKIQTHKDLKRPAHLLDWAIWEAGRAKVS